MSSHSSRASSASAQPRRHIIKACEGCRHQKIKCNGGSPCERCARLSLPCTVRTIARKRRRETQTPPKRPTQSENDSDLLRLALRPVRVTDATGKATVYGPTSTVALLQLLSSQSNVSLDVQPHLAISDLSPGGLRYPLQMPFQAYNPPPTLGLSLTPPLCLSTIPSQVLQFFLNRYLGTAWAILPLQTPAQLTALFSSSCAAFSQNAPPPAMYPILLYQLAMGSLVTVQSETADLLVQESELFVSAGANLPEFFDLQLNYYRETGRFEKAYAMLGSVATKVFSSGMHLEPQSPEVASLMRSLLSAETFICIALGRPPLLGPSMRASSENEPPSSTFLTGLFNILTPSLRAQQMQAGDLDELWSTIWTAHAKLKAFWEEHAPPEDDASAVVDRRRIGENRALKSGLYEYAILTNLRPVLLYIGHKQAAASLDTGDGSALSPASSATTATTTTTTTRTDGSSSHDENLAMASETILVAAKNIIANIAEVRQRGSLAKDLPMNSYFLETACLSLIAYGVWHKSPGAVRDSLDLGVRCLEHLRYQAIAAKRLETVNRVLEGSGLMGG
ncbi:hypothetical protein BDV18DRAFT_161688 [Aspergillus unguis]